MYNRSTLAFALLNGALVTTFVLVTLNAVADQDPSTDQVPRQIPYNGTLELDGERVTATGADGLWVRFELVDSSAPGGPTVYRHTQQIDVVDGRFAVVLGPTDDDATALDGVVAGADALTVSITLLGDPADDADDTLLTDPSRPQRLLVTPYVLWATNATNFTVARDLTILDGVDTPPALEVSGQLEVPAIETGTLNPGGDDITFGGGVYVSEGLSLLGAPSDLATIDASGDLTVSFSCAAHGGVGTNQVCCAASCGSCGGSGCGTRPGGSENCCTNPITVAGRSCLDFAPPCITPPGLADAVSSLDASLLTSGVVTTSSIDGASSWNPGGESVLFHTPVTFGDALELSADPASEVTPPGEVAVDFDDNGSDDAWIRYYTEAPDEMILQLGVTGDSADVIELVQGGQIQLRLYNTEVRSALPIRLGDRLSLGSPGSQGVNVAGNGFIDGNVAGNWYAVSACDAQHYVCGMRAFTDTGTADHEGVIGASIRCCPL